MRSHRHGRKPALNIDKLAVAVRQSEARSKEPFSIGMSDDTNEHLPIVMSFVSCEVHKPYIPPAKFEEKKSDHSEPKTPLRMSRISPYPKNNNAKDIRVCIISWTGKHDKAKSIYKSLKSSAQKITIVYSDQDPNFSFEDKYSSMKTSNELFWGDKFKTSIDLFTESVLLIIHADCECENWRLLFEKCKNAFSANEKLGIWSPKTTGTVFPGEITKILSSSDEKLFYVAYIDGIVFAMNRKIGNRMKQLDYSKNVYGWGIDWFAAAYAHSEGMALMMDNTISINHPSDRGYDSATALGQMKPFLDQMDLKERIQYGMIFSHIKYMKSLHSSRQLNNSALLERKKTMPTATVN